MNNISRLSDIIRDRETETWLNKTTFDDENYTEYIEDEEDEKEEENEDEEIINLEK